MNMTKRKQKHDGKALVKPGETPLTRLREEFDRAFDRVWRSVEEGRWPSLPDIAPWPAMDVAEDEKAMTLKIDAPGVEAKNIDIEVSGNLLTVRGSREEESTETDGGMRRHERRSGQFRRSTCLPSYVDAGKIEARYASGILTITVPKIPGQGPRRVEVRTA